MAGKHTREIPWCTIILVAGAITMHSLVLIGNLETGKMFNNLGHSTKGWSHVGQNLGHSLANELDVIMGNVTTQLTSTIEQLMQIKSAIDTGLSLIGGTTDATLSQVNSKVALMASAQIAIAASSKSHWPGPKTKARALLQSPVLKSGPLKPLTAPRLTGMDIGGETDAVWMMETFRINPPRLAAMQKNISKEEMEAGINTLRASVINTFVNCGNLPPPLKSWPKDKKTAFEDLVWPVESEEDFEADIKVVEWCIENPTELEAALNGYLRDHYKEANDLWHKAAKDATVFLGCTHLPKDFFWHLSSHMS